MTLFFDFDTKLNHQVGQGYPSRDLPMNSLVDGPARMVNKFHGHGVIWHPTLSPDELKEFLRNLLPGSDRVHIKSLTPGEKDKDGFATNGLAGWGEYSTMEKTAVDLPNGDKTKDNVAAVQNMLVQRESWIRTSRRFTFGTKRR